MILDDCSCYDTPVATVFEEILDNKFKHLWRLIGNMPMLEIAYRYKRECRKIFILEE